MGNFLCKHIINETSMISCKIGYKIRNTMLSAIPNHAHFEKAVQSCLQRLFSSSQIHYKIGKHVKVKQTSPLDKLRKKRQADAVIKWNTECAKLFGSPIAKSYNKKNDDDSGESVKRPKGKKQRDAKSISTELGVETPKALESNVNDMPLTYSQELGKLLATTDLHVGSMILPVRTKGLHGLSDNIEEDNTEIIGPLKLSSEDQQTLESLIMFPMFEKQSSQTTLKIKPLTEIENFKLNFSGAYPSVTTILNATRPPEAQFFLDRWKKKMIQELGEEGFLKYQQEQLDAGNKFHQVIEKHFEGKEDPEAKEAVKRNWDSIQPVLRDISNVKIQEGKVRHPDLHYCGVLDCLAEYRGNLCVMEWKMSKKPKPTLSNTFDYPLQVAAYIGAVNFDDKFSDKVKKGLIAISYNNGAKADVHLMSPGQCSYYWGQWLRRLHTYWGKVLRGLIVAPKSYS